MKKLSILLCICSILTAQSAIATPTNPNNFWQPAYVDESVTNRQRNSAAHQSKAYTLDIAALDARLTTENGIVIALPLPDGKLVRYRLTPADVMAPELAARYPSIRTYTGVQLDQPQHKGRFDISPHGFHAVFDHGEDTVFIDPLQREDRTRYQSYFKRHAQPLTNSGNRAMPRVRLKAPHNLARAAKLSSGETVTYRIAVAATAEYTEFHGGSKEKGLAAVVTMLNRVNEVYQRDLGIALQLVANNDAIIYTDADSDPFNNTDEDIDLAGETINNAIGEDQYDVGHVVGTGGGGLAGLGVVCSSFKAEGVTGSDSPTNDAFYIDYVAHELGHQFGAEHTFNGSSEACDGNRADTSAYEPGSASSIMGYAGICGEQNLQSNSDPFFHIHSVDQIRSFIQQGDGKSCGTRVTNSNQAPVVDAGPDYHIPARTPFVLTGSAQDPEQDTLSYSWQQFDLGTATKSQTEDNQDDGKRPLFRTFEPTAAPSRTLPRMATLLSGQDDYGETLPTTDRQLNFRLVVRDNRGNLADDAMKITVASVERGFAITAPATGTVWQTGTQLVAWDTANTQNPPVSCAQVDIHLSTDAGQSFDRLLASQVANTGTAEVTLTDLQTAQARFKIQCSDNIFFTVNSGDVTIADKPISTQPVFNGQSPLAVMEDHSITLSLSDLSFAGAVDGLLLSAGENYSVAGLTVTPSGNYHGELSVAAKATSSGTLSDSFKIKIVVSAVNDAPNAQDDSYTLQSNDSSQTLAVLDNDQDVDDDALTISSVSYQGSGTVQINDSNLVYTPGSGFSGTEIFSYTIADTEGATATAQVTVQIKAASSSSGGSQSWGLLLVLISCTLYRIARTTNA